MKLLSVQETLDRVLLDGRSIARFGDGELELMLRQRSIVFQKYSPALRQELIESLSERGESVLCATNHRIARSPVRRKASQFLRKQVASGFEWRGVVYDIRVRQWFYYAHHNFRLLREMRGLGGVPEEIGDAECFWLESHLTASRRDYRRALFEKIRAWVREADVLVISPREPLRGPPIQPLISSLKAQRVMHLEVPPTDAFEHKGECERALATSGAKIAILQCGPLATMLSLRHGSPSCQCVDAGSFNQMLAALIDEFS